MIAYPVADPGRVVGVAPKKIPLYFSKNLNIIYISPPNFFKFFFIFQNFI